MDHWARTVIEELLWASKIKSEKTRAAVSRIIKAVETRDVHLFRKEEFEAIADGLSECVDVDELSQLMWKATTSFGFQNYAIFLLKQGPSVLVNPKICTSFNKDWVERYVDQRYEFIDPVMVRAAQTDGFFKYEDVLSECPIVKDFWLDAEQHRVGRSGVCWAFTRSGGTRVGVSLSTMGSSEKVSEILRLYGLDLYFIAELAAEAFCFSASGPLLHDDTLTSLELRFLYVLSTSPNPQDALAVSSSFGSNEALQSSIRRKLGVETVYQAIAVAASKGWFNLLPYHQSEILRPVVPLLGFPEVPSHQNGFCESSD